MLNRTESIAEVSIKDCSGYAVEWTVCYGKDLAGQLILQLRGLMPPQNQDLAQDHRRALAWKKGLQKLLYHQSICLNTDLALVFSRLTIC